MSGSLFLFLAIFGKVMLLHSVRGMLWFNVQISSICWNWFNFFETYFLNLTRIK